MQNQPNTTAAEREDQEAIDAMLARMNSQQKRDLKFLLLGMLADAAA